MDIAVLTIFPELLSEFAGVGMVRIARERGLATVTPIDIRAYATDRYGSVDDYPYGGGPGMVMAAAPLKAALTAAREHVPEPAPVVLMSAQGHLWDQAAAGELAAASGVIVVCGRYKGVDERFIQRYVDLEISLGDFVLSGGEVAAMSVIESTLRLVPGVLGNEASATGDSIASGFLEGPLYTRPETFEDMDVPEVLLSGHHARIAAWRRRQALERTLQRRPDLLREVGLTRDEEAWLARQTDAGESPDARRRGS